MTAWTRYRVALVAIAAVAVMAVWSACGGDPASTGPGSGVLPPSLACPANISLANAPAVGETATFSLPTLTGGTPPVTTTCTPTSGSTFPVGSDTVTCTAKDAISRSAVCSFSVTVAAAPLLSAVNFVAFGDSETAGENGNYDSVPVGYSFPGPACQNYRSTQAAAQMRRLQTLRPAWVDVANSYPTQLLHLLMARYAGEAFTMDNEGFPGETAALGSGRLVAGCVNNESVFKFDNPSVLLLMEGINDIAQDGYNLTSQNQTTIYNYLKSDVAAAVQAKVPYIFVSTILPIGLCSSDYCNAPTDQPDVTADNIQIDGVNELIRAGIPGAIIVDGNGALKQADPTLVSLIGLDGLHPSAAGYTVLAQAFMTSITTHIPASALRRKHR